MLDSSGLSTFDDTDAAGAAGGAGAGVGAGAGGGAAGSASEAPLSVRVVGAKSVEDPETSKTYTVRLPHLTFEIPAPAMPPCHRVCVRGLQAYTIAVRQAGVAEEWQIERRYTDFLELDKMIKDSPLRSRVTATLPPKKLFGNQAPGVLRERQAAFAAYLTQCIRAAGGHDFAPLTSFLDVRQQARRCITPSSMFELPDARDLPGMMSLAAAAEAFPAS